MSASDIELHDMLGMIERCKVLVSIDDLTLLVGEKNGTSRVKKNRVQNVSPGMMTLPC